MIFFGNPMYSLYNQSSIYFRIVVRPARHVGTGSGCSFKLQGIVFFGLKLLFLLFLYFGPVSASCQKG